GARLGRGAGEGRRAVRFVRGQRRRRRVDGGLRRAASRGAPRVPGRDLGRGTGAHAQGLLQAALDPRHGDGLAARLRRHARLRRAPRPASAGGLGLRPRRRGEGLRPHGRGRAEREDRATDSGMTKEKWPPRNSNEKAARTGGFFVFHFAVLAFFRDRSSRRSPYALYACLYRMMPDRILGAKKVDFSGITMSGFFMPASATATSSSMDTGCRATAMS